jgi:hypothetical protein
MACHELQLAATQPWYPQCHDDPQMLTPFLTGRGPTIVPVGEGYTRAKSCEVDGSPLECATPELLFTPRLPDGLDAVVDAILGMVG